MIPMASSMVEDDLRWGIKGAKLTGIVRSRIDGFEF